MMNTSNNTSPANPYDELPYCAYPIAWTSPERIALASLLHGGPRVPLDGYRVLELGCANGANLLPMAWYRQQGDFTGMDGSARQIALANEGKDKLGLSNLQFVHGDFSSAVNELEGPFDIIMAHGVFSWISDEARNAMLEMCSSLLGTNGLLYLNYNAHPGWTVRGMVRDFLMQHTAHVSDLKERAELCREVSARVISPLQAKEHSYSRLMGNEFQMVVNQNPAYIAHEYLSPENNAYWRDEFYSILKNFGFDHVADADFNSISNRITTEYGALVKEAGVSDDVAGDSADLICYRQMQSPILTHSPFVKKDCDESEFANLFMASDLIPVDTEEGQNPSFKRPSGQEIESSKESISRALIELQPLWPRGLNIKSLFADVADVRQDIEWLLDHQLIQLRCIEPGDFEAAPEPLNALEQSLRNIATSPWHTTKETKTKE
jgi:SAM-dependent methyltransferase